MSSTADSPRPRSALPEPEAEVELWWGGYSGRTMLPGFAVCAVLTAGMIGVAWYLYREEDVPGDRARHVVYGLAFVVWFVQFLRLARHTASLNYRLTTRRLFRCRGLDLSRVEEIDLPDVTRVTVVQTPLERHLGVGRVRVETVKQRMELTGVYEPHRAAGLIERQVKRMRGEQG